MKKIAIIDFEAGNIHSMHNAVCKVAGAQNVAIVKDASGLDEVSHIILPGVGAFDKAMFNLQSNSGLISKLQHKVFEQKIPFLGVCVGMQLLADVGYENKATNGLGWIAGEVKEISGANVRVPHIGWNDILIDSNDVAQPFGIFNKKDFYFVHSYYFRCMNKDNIIAKVNYEVDFPAIIAKDNIVATQFHPEKSGDNGLEFLNYILN